MIDPGAPIGPLDAAQNRPRAQKAPASDAGFGAALSRELDGPPPELRAEVAAASRRWEELRSLDRELSFEPGSGGERMVVEVRDLDGRVVSTVAPSVALEIALGAPLP